jgi:hypothetical protein
VRSGARVGGRKLVDVLAGVNMPSVWFGCAIGQPGAKFFADLVSERDSIWPGTFLRQESPPSSQVGGEVLRIAVDVEAGEGGDFGGVSVRDVNF